MKKTYKVFGIVALAAMFIACSEDSNSSTPNTAGGAIEDTSFIAEGISSSSEGTVQSSSSEAKSPNSNWTKSDKRYVDSLLQTYGPPVYIEASDISCDFDVDECPSNFNCDNGECLCSEGDDCPYAAYYDSIAAYYSSATTLPASPVEYGFSTERKIGYDSLNTKGRSCIVEEYPLEDGARWWGTGNTISNMKTILIRKNEDSRFAHYMLNNEYGYATDQANCPIDSTAFADECKKINGILTSYTSGCSKLQLTCIAKIDPSVNLDNLTAPFEGECKEFIANESADWEIPQPTVSVTCRDDPSMGGKIVCDTLEVYENR